MRRKAGHTPHLHAFATVLRVKRFSVEEIQGMLGHSSRITTEIYAKLTFIAVGIVLVLKIRNEVLRDAPGDGALPLRAKRLAAASAICWVGAIASGRLLAYTFHWLRVGIAGGF